MIKTIVKRDGREIPFNEVKIANAIFKAASSVAEKEGSIASFEQAEKLAKKVSAALEEKYGNTAPTVEQIQDEVVNLLISENLTKKQS